MRHIAQVIGNVKVGCDVKIGPKTLLIGPIGSGKTTIVNTLELALSARASDVEGVDLSAKEDRLLSLAPPEKPLIARAIFDSGEEAKFEIKRVKKAGKWASKRAEHFVPEGVDPERVFPLRPLREAARGLPEKRRRFFLKEAILDVSDKDVRARIPNALKSKYDDAIKEVIGELPVDRLIEVGLYAKKKAALFAKTAEDYRSTAMTVGQALGSPPTEEDLAAARNSVKVAQGVYEEAVRRYEKQQAVKDAVARVIERGLEIESCEKQIDELDTAMRSANEEREKLITSAKPISAGVRASAEATIYHAVSDRHDCLVCGGHIEDLAERVTKAKARLAGANTAEIDRLTNLISSHAFERAASAQRLAEKKARQEEDKAIGADEDDTTPISIEDARAAVGSEQTKLAQMEATARSWQTTTEGRNRAVSAKRESESWDELVVACSEAVTLLFARGVESFIERVQRYLPEDDKFGIDFGAAHVDFGLLRGAVLHTALSGGEWVKVTAALATTCVRPDSPFSIIIPEDRAWDPRHLSLALAALKEIPSQVVMTSTIEPLQRLAGWTYVELGDVVRRDDGTRPLALEKGPPKTLAEQDGF